MDSSKLIRRIVPLSLGSVTLGAMIYGCNVVQQAQETVTTSVNGVVHGFQEAKQATQLDESDEDEMGKSVAILITNQYAPVDNQKLVRYVNMVGYTLVASSFKPDAQFYFGVLDSPDIGAFSGPNGYVMVTRGALLSMRDEAELAGVLAHEITHVLEHHGLATARAAAQKSGYLDATLAVIQSADAVKIIDGGVDTVVRNGYDKPQEQAADAGAVRLLIAAGYDPRSYANYLSHLAAMQAAAGQPAAGVQQVNAAVTRVMSTHPGIETRYPAVKQEIDANNAPPGATMKDRFIAFVQPPGH